jgi:hypothetical protein
MMQELQYSSILTSSSPTGTFIITITIATSTLVISVAIIDGCDAVELGLWRRDFLGRGTSRIIAAGPRLADEACGGWAHRF